MLREDIVGPDEPVPVLDGRRLPYVDLDNAATTPPLRAVVDAVERFLPMASSVHRGSGYKSRVSTAAFEEARAIVGDFVGADADRDVVVFTKNTTEAINRFARTMTIAEDAVVLTTVLEHHSNLLPWRRRGPVVHVRAHRDGSVDEEHLDAVLAHHAGHVALLAVTGASNVTGIVPAVHRMAAKVHAVGGRILVDAAQLAGHRPIDMRPHADAGHLDAVAVSAHKMYAPYGAGALIAGRDCFGVEPDDWGGGTVRAVTLDAVVWADLPDRAEAGSPNLLGVVAFAAAARHLREVGMTALVTHEQALAAYLRHQLATLGGVSVAGPATSELGVVPFAIAGRDHRLVAAVLGYEHGVGVRSGCFCAQPYVHHLLGLGATDVARWVADAARGDVRLAPGLVRISVGGYNDRTDIDRAVEGLHHIIAGEIAGTYRQRPDGSYVPLPSGPDISSETRLTTHLDGSNRRAAVTWRPIRAYDRNAFNSQGDHLLGVTMSDRSEALRLFITNTFPRSRLDVGGEIDLSTVDALRDHLALLVEAGTGEVAVDMADVTFCDATGVHVLLDVSLALRASGRSMRVINPSASVTRVVELTGLDTIMFAAPIREPQGHQQIPKRTCRGRRPPARPGDGARDEGARDADGQAHQRPVS